MTSCVWRAHTILLLRNRSIKATQYKSIHFLYRLFYMHCIIFLKLWNLLICYSVLNPIFTHVLYSLADGLLVHLQTFLITLHIPIRTLKGLERKMHIGRDADYYYLSQRNWFWANILLFCIVFKYIIYNCSECFPKTFWFCCGVLTLINMGTINQQGFILIWIGVAVLHFCSDNGGVVLLFPLFF